MSNPADPLGDNPFSYDPLGRVPYVPAEEPLEYPDTPEPPSRPRANACATLSLVFAFVFAPAGAILGHLGLAQIRRTGEPGRERALAGLWLSYALITLAVVALAGWATFAAVRSNQAAAPTTTSGAPAPPTVAAADLAGLLPALSDVRRITGDQNLATGKSRDQVTGNGREGQIDRSECRGSIGAGSPDAYRVEAVFGYRASEFSDTQDPRDTRQVVTAVVAFQDAAAAQNQLKQLLSEWHQCGGSDVKVILPSGQALTFSVGIPTAAGNGITTIEVVTKGLRRSVRALAAKNNVVVDLNLSYAAAAAAGTDRADPAVGLANYILGKIPG